MNLRSQYPTEANLYTSLWNKYRPVILKLMSGAATEPQQYKLFPHEFKAMGEKVKKGYSFSLQAYNGKALNNIKGSAVAQDLLTVLQQSKTAVQLMTEATFELNMDKHFVLQVNRIEMPTVEDEVEVVAES